MSTTDIPLSEEHQFALKKGQQKHDQQKEYWQQVFQLIKWISFVASLLTGFPQIATTILNLIRGGV